MTGKIGKPTKCRACQAEIAFIKTEKGKTMPVNAEPIWILPDENGLPFIRADGRIIRGLLIGDAYDGERKAMEVYESHFATCPEADSLRKRGKK